MTDIVTVTYSEEKDLMIRQAKSINKFVEGTINHVVIIQDEKMSLRDWYRLLNPLYTKHTLKLFPNNCDLKHHGGWVQSLQLKYTASEHVQTNYYLILDSKNFFCKSTDLDKWPIIEGSGHPNPGEWTLPFVRFFSEQIKKPVPKVISNNITPYRVKTSVVKSMLKKFNFKDVIDKFGSLYPQESESGSIMYDFFGEEIVFMLSYDHLPFRAVWDGLPVITKKFLKDIDNSPHIKVFGIHTDHKQSDKSLKAFQDWCNRLGV